MLRLQERTPSLALSPFDWLGLHDILGSAGLPTLSATGKNEGGEVTENMMPCLDFVYHASAIFVNIIVRHEFLL